MKKICKNYKLSKNHVVRLAIFVDKPTIKSGAIDLTPQTLLRWNFGKDEGEGFIDLLLSWINIEIDVCIYDTRIP